jgi:RNA polymerase sigma-70 factor (ECF subfamily)
MSQQNYHEEIDDAELVRLSLLDSANFVHIINRYQTKMLQYVRRLGARRLEDAEDIVQDIFLKVYLNLNDFNLDLQFSSWLYRIAHNQTISQFRKNQVRPELYSSPLDEHGFEALSSDLSLEKELDLKLLQEHLKEALLSLNPEQREIIVLKFFEERSYQEISDILKKPTGSVASLLNRAKKALLKKLQGNIK